MLLFHVHILKCFLFFMRTMFFQTLDIHRFQQMELIYIVFYLRNDFTLLNLIKLGIHHLIFLPLFVHKPANKTLKVLIFHFYNFVYIQQIYRLNL
jgi:hypothetical protein